MCMFVKSIHWIDVWYNVCAVRLHWVCVGLMVKYFYNKLEIVAVHSHTENERTFGKWNIAVSIK